MILIATQEVEFGEKISRRLQEHNYVTSFSPEGKKALDVAANLFPALVVVDLYLQNPSGLETLRRLRAQGFDGKVILLGGFSISPEVPQALQLGVDQVIGRPLSLGQVESVIQFAVGASKPKDLSED